MAFLDDILSDINTISDGISSNSLIVEARESVDLGLKSFMISPKEKATIKANFEMQFAGGIINKIIDSVLQARVSDVQIQSTYADIANKQKENELQAQRISLAQKELEIKSAELSIMNREIALKEAISSAQVSGINSEITLRGEQTQMVQQQRLTEINNTQKVLKESDLLQSNKLLVEAQILTQEKQRLDVMAGINIKNQQAISTQESAKFEEARKHVLLKSTQFNNQIQKSKEENSVLNSLAVDDKFIITEGHLERIKDALDSIDTSDITYTSGITAPVGIVDVGA